MYKTKICGVDIRIGDVLEDYYGEACVVYDLWRLSDGGATVVYFYRINRIGNPCADCVTEVSFSQVFKRKVKI